MPKKISLRNVEDEQIKAQYPYIVAWGKALLSFDYYILDQCYLAQKDGAPANAVYKRDGKWILSTDCCEKTMKELDAAVECMRRTS